MASGKSWFGRRVAAALGLEFVDLDDEITSRYGTPEEIFARGGETLFRECEKQTLAEVISACGPDSVIALGGGTVLDKGNVRLLGQACFKIVWIDSSLDNIWSEIGNSIRPLVKGKSKQEIASMMARRRPAYEQAADVTFKVKSFDYETVVSSLVRIVAEL